MVSIDPLQELQELDKWQSEKRVTAYPTLLAFLGYAFVPSSSYRVDDNSNLKKDSISLGSSLDLT